MRTSLAALAIIAPLVAPATANANKLTDSLAADGLIHMTCQDAGQLAYHMAFLHEQGHSLAFVEHLIAKNQDPPSYKAQEKQIAEELWASKLGVDDWRPWIEGRCIRASERRFYGN